MSIPQKSHFRFSELGHITGIKPYVLRYWETEFEEIAPVTGDDGQKLYSRQDVELILKIKALLFENKLSLLEAKAFLRRGEELGAEEVRTDTGPKGPALKGPAALSFEELERARAPLFEGLAFIKSLKKRQGWS